MLYEVITQPPPPGRPVEPLRLNPLSRADPMPGRRLRLLIAVLAALVAVAWATGAFEGDPSTVDVPGLDIPADRLDRIALSGAMDLVV